MTDAVSLLIPADLRSHKQWVLWRAERRNGKVTKIPYVADGKCRRASTTDPATWSAYEKARQVVNGYDGIGFVFSEDDSFCGIDLDGCRDLETGELDPAAAGIVADLDSYTEISPSGTGIHVVIRGRLRGSRNRRGPIEIYDRGRYFAMTGRLLEGMPHSPMPRQRELDAFVARLFPPASTTAVRFGPIVPADDRELLERAFNARNGIGFSRLWNGDTSGYPSRSEADLALCSRLAFWTGDDPDRIDQLFRSSGLFREKWQRADYRERTIARALR
jgi:putative DNA primase/helicase